MCKNTKTHIGFIDNSCEDSLEVEFSENEFPEEEFLEEDYSQEEYYEVYPPFDITGLSYDESLYKRDMVEEMIDLLDKENN